MTRTSTPAKDAIADALDAGCVALAARLDEINDLNVFPVADGDTGTNMLATITAAAEAAHASVGAHDRAERIARAALLAARGNSGMILSQLVRGAAEATDAGAPLDGAAARRAFRVAADTAYSSVREPVEGTMLTVARRMAEAAERAHPEASLEEVIAHALDGGWQAVEETTGLLPVLRQAKVVDSGGLGVAVLIDGIAAYLEGREIAAPSDAPPTLESIVDHPPSRFRYCTSFVLEDISCELAELEDLLAPFGDSLLVMGDARQAKVHIHTDVPTEAVAIGEGIGDVGAVTVDDMRQQEAERAARLARRLGTPEAASAAALALVETEQLARIAAGLGARPLIVGADPAAELADALREHPPERTVVVAHAELATDVRAAVVAHGAALVVASTRQAALASLVAFDANGSRDDCAAEMADLAGEVLSAAIPSDARDPRAMLERRVTELVAEGAGLVTVLIGAAVEVAPNDVEHWVRGAAPEIEVEAHHSGLDDYAFLIGAE
jgi:DAK2 domain fusion protein YloV